MEWLSALSTEEWFGRSGLVCFAFAIVHTFAVARFRAWSLRFPKEHAAHQILHLLGEVEVVFGSWAAVFILGLVATRGLHASADYLSGLSFTEPAFVFVVMAVCSSRPILHFASSSIAWLARGLPLKPALGLYAITMTVGPWLGSLITEPAAMTVTALILWQRYYTQNLSSRLMYATLGLLFVNISIGGTFTHFAAPPVLMVAPVWGWDTPFLFTHFGWKGALSCVLSTSLVMFVFRRELGNMRMDSRPISNDAIPAWVVIVHLGFLAAIVLASHYLVFFSGLFLFFLGLFTATHIYQDQLRLREGLLVAFFLGGLVILGPPQRWWLEPLLSGLRDSWLYVGAMGLTAITDNAALTYLGSQIPLSESARYSLVAGSLVGGGLTVIANAPNPVGFGILNPAFGEEGIQPWRLLGGALAPTAIAALCYWLL